MLTVQTGVRSHKAAPGAGSALQIHSRSQRHFASSGRARWAEVRLQQAQLEPSAARAGGSGKCQVFRAEDAGQARAEQD